MKPAVFAIISSPICAESVVDELCLAGFSSKDISVLFPGRGGTGKFAHVKSSKLREGACMSGTLGGLAGWLVSFGTLTIPGAGSYIAAGPISAELNGVAVDAPEGGLCGALAGLGFSKNEARFYAGKLEEENILIAAHTENSQEVKIIREIFERADANDIGVTPEVAVRDCLHLST